MIDNIGGVKMNRIGNVSIEIILDVFRGTMQGVAKNVSRKSRGRLDPEDLFQDLFFVLQGCYDKYKDLSLIEFTKILHSSFNNFVCNLISQKRSRNRVKHHSIDEKISENSNGTFEQYLERSELSDEAYKNGILDVLNNVSTDAGMAIIESFDPHKRGNSSVGIHEAFQEAKEYLIG